MKRYAVVCKQDEISQNLEKKIRLELDACMEYNEKNPEIVISIGGDGTMLLSVHKYIDQLSNVAFIGIHTGTLGFLTDYQKDEYMAFIDDIKNQEYQIYTRELLEVDTGYDVHLALNEMRIENNMRSQVLDVSINSEMFETFRGNGLCVSTAVGSTAYNKSINGAVIYSHTGLMQLSEIAGIHHNAYRSLGSSLILDKTHTIHFESQDFQYSVLGIDHLVYDMKDIESIDVKLSNQYARFIQLKNVSFIERLKRAFLSK